MNLNLFSPVLDILLYNQCSTSLPYKLTFGYKRFGHSYYVVLFRLELEANEALNVEERELELRQRRQELDFNLETFTCAFNALAQFDDWRPNLASLLQPMPFPEE